MPNDQQTQPTPENPTPTTPTTTSTQNPNPPLPNDPAARTPTGELKDASAKPAEGNPPKDPKAIPDSYTFGPDGNTAFSPEAIAEITPVFKELGLDQASADKLIGFHNKQANAIKEHFVNQVTTMREDWRNQVSADKEIGGKLDAVKAEIGKALTNFPAELVTEFKDAMDLTGAGDHPAFIKTFYKLAQLVNEGKPVSGNSPSPFGQKAPGAAQRPSLAASMYPNLPQR